MFYHCETVSPVTGAIRHSAFEAPGFTEARTKFMQLNPGVPATRIVVVAFDSLASYTQRNVSKKDHK